MSNVERFYPIIQFLPLGFTIFNGLLHASRHLFRNQVRLKGNDEDDSIWGNIFKPFIEIKDIYEFIGDQNPEMDILQASTSKEKSIRVIRPLLIGFIFGLNGFLCLDYGSAASAIAWVYASFHVIRSRNPMSYSLLCLSILSITSSSTIMISDHSKIQFFILIPILSLSLFVSILTQPIQSLPILQSSSNQQRSLEDGNCSLLSSFIYGWMAKIMSVKDLKRDDIYMLSVLNRTGILSWKFGNLSQEKSLLWRIIRANVSDIVIDFSLKLVAVFFDFARPLLLQQILTSTTTTKEKYIYASLAGASMISRTIAEVQHFHHARRIGLRLKSILTIEVFKKLEKRRASGGNNEEGENSSVGRVINMVTTDINRILRMGCDSHLIYGSPLQIVIGISLLCYVLNLNSVLAGLAVLGISIPLNFFIGLESVKITKSISEARDARLSVTDEVFRHIQSIKLMGINLTFINYILKFRKIELKWLIRSWLNRIILTTLAILTGYGIPLLSYYVYTRTDKLNVPIIATSLSLFGMIRQPLTEIPDFFVRLLSTLVSVKRLTVFLKEDEVDRVAISEEIRLDNSTFRWSSSSIEVKKEELQNISIIFPVGSTTLISGPTASGKSSLLLAILGEMNQVSGKMNRPANLAYASQTPYLERLSIRSNILFGQIFDAERYQQVLEICSLNFDLNLMVDGDETICLNLSGGQKARVALARAIYSPFALLLDDVLASLDSSVSAFFIDQLNVSPILINRTILFVSHALELVLPRAHYHVQLENGKVAQQGFTGLAKSNLISPSPFKLSGSLSGLQGKRESIFDSKVKVEELEERATGAVKLKSLLYYLKAGKFHWIGLSLFALMKPGLSYIEALWLTRWGESNGLADEYYLIGFSIISISSLTFIIFSTGILYLASYRSSKATFKDLLVTLMNATFPFFKVPSSQSRITSRLTNDISIVDESLSPSINTLLNSSTALVSYVLINVYYLPLSILPTSLAIFFFIKLLFLPFLRTQRELNRISATTTAPIISGFHQVIAGITTIRAFGRTENYRATLIDLVDSSQSLWYCQCTLDVWLSLRTQCLSSIVLASTAILGVYFEIQIGNLSILIHFAAAIISTLDGLCNSIMRLSLDLNSIERIDQLLKIELESIEGIIPPENWLSDSAPIVEFKNVSIKYDSKEVISNLNLKINSHEKLAIVGRTGSGKSTTAMSLLRYVDPCAGSILIDGLDISNISLSSLRSRITFVPQDSIILSSSLRNNIDPENTFTDEEIIKIVFKVGLDNLLPLDKPLTITLSHGQNQLLALARALIRNSKLLILDETNSAMDLTLDKKVQSLLPLDTTVICIAHRLDSIMNYDRILVLDKGKIVELDTPQNLLSIKDGIFKKMWDLSKSTTELL